MSIRLGSFSFRDALDIRIESMGWKKRLICLDLSSLQFIDMGFCTLGARDKEPSSLTMRSNEKEA